MLKKIYKVDHGLTPGSQEVWKYENLNLGFSVVHLEIWENTHHWQWEAALIIFDQEGDWSLFDDFLPEHKSGLETQYTSDSYEGLIKHLKNLRPRTEI
jgi:hypothetical protein